MAADPFCRGVGDNVCAVLERTDEEASCAKGVIDDNWDPGIMCHSSNRFKIRDIVFRISDRLNINRLCLVVDCGGNILWLIAVDEFRVDPEAREEDFELVVGATVEVAGGNNVVPCVGERGNGHELRRLARGGGHSGDTTFECGDTFLEDVNSGVHYPGVDVAKFFKPEEAGAMGGVVEDKRLGGVSRWCFRWRGK